MKWRGISGILYENHIFWKLKKNFIDLFDGRKKDYKSIMKFVILYSSGQYRSYKQVEPSRSKKIKIDL